MIRFNINGEYIELPENFSVQLQKKNPLFAFDELSTERSVSFDIPATPKNDRIFGLAKWAATRGDAMRKRFEAVMEGSLVSKKGYLYISDYKYKENQYGAVFIGGLAFNVKAFGNHEYGNLWLGTYNGEIIDADDNPQPLVARVKYHCEDEESEYWQRNIMYSVNIGELFRQLNEQGVQKIEGLASGEVFRYIPKGDGVGRIGDVVERLINKNPTTKAMGLSTVQKAIQAPVTLVTEERETGDPEDRPIVEQSTNCFRSGGGMITFPNDTPENLCICYPKGYDRISSSYYWYIGFAGSRSFEDDGSGYIRYIGEPLAGKTVEIPDEFFILMTGDGYHRDPFHQGHEIWFIEFDYSQQPEYDIKVRIKDGAYVSYIPAMFQVVPQVAMLYNLPFGDLLKLYAAVTGKLIGITSDGGIKFIDTLDDLEYLNIDDRITGIKSLTRDFRDFAQHNYVFFSESDNVLDGERIRTEYTINNVNLEEEKDISELPAIEGGKYEGTDFILIRGLDWRNYLPSRDDDIVPESVMTKAGDGAYLSRVTIPKSSLLKELCDESTSIQVNVKMMQFEYDKIDSGTGFYLRGNKYVWTEAQYKKGIATLKLSKVLMK